MKAGVAKALRGELLHIGRRHTSAKDAELSEAYVIEQNENDVGCAFGRTQDLGNVGGSESW